MAQKTELLEYTGALQFLSVCLEQYHGEKTVILIDEYDAKFVEKGYSVIKKYGNFFVEKIV